MKVIIKPLSTYCHSISKRPDWRTPWCLLFHFPVEQHSARVGWISTDGGNWLTTAGALSKRLLKSYRPRAGMGPRGTGRWGGRVLNIKSASGKRVFKVPSWPHLLRKASMKSSPLRRPPDGGAGLGLKICVRPRLAWGLSP